MLLRARVVYPVDSPPIENGAIWIGEGKIRQVGRAEDVRPATQDPVIDLGDSILLPGLVNAHCHLDYTNFARHIPPPASFTDWIKQLISLKAGWSYTDFAESWLQGQRQLIEFGTTTVGNIASVPELLSDVLPEMAVRTTCFREMITVRSRSSARELVSSAIQDFSNIHNPRYHPGLSPHAPYSTTQELVSLTATACRELHWKWSMHLAESAEEQAMFAQRSGAMFQWLKSQREMGDCGALSPFQWLEATGALSPDLLLAHVNVIEPEEISRLAKTGTQVVHCPRSHDYFAHPKFPYESLRSAGVPICLGTDSLVSVRCGKAHPPALNLFAEMQTFASFHPGVAPQQILQHATEDGARALGWDQVGALKPGFVADLISIPWTGDARAAAHAILHHQGPVSTSMVDGCWLKPPPA